MFPYVVSISITDSTGSDKQLFHTDLYNYMPYFSAGMPDIKILLLAAPAHILPQAVPRHTEDILYTSSGPSCHSLSVPFIGTSYIP